MSNRYTKGARRRRVRELCVDHGKQIKRKIRAKRALRQRNLAASSRHLAVLARQHREGVRVTIRKSNTTKVLVPRNPHLAEFFEQKQRETVEMAKRLW